MTTTKKTRLGSLPTITNEQASEASHWFLRGGGKKTFFEAALFNATPTATLIFLPTHTIWRKSFHIRKTLAKKMRICYLSPQKNFFLLWKLQRCFRAINNNYEAMWDMFISHKSTWISFKRSARISFSPVATSSVSPGPTFIPMKSIT